MTSTELWDIYYHAIKQWIPKATDHEVREFVRVLMIMSCKEAVKYEDNKIILKEERDEGRN